ncbi:MAG TPA: DUF2975 domain-containing protein [Vicinamibacterales bacterium]|nr:DUF2975 domain-containing protein [Vicinamibacterales bacterium]
MPEKLAMVETVRAGDPFTAANADRLQTVAWMLLALQVLSMVIGGIANAISTPAHPLHISAGFSISGWLAVLLTFVLARVFAAGAVMRDDLAGINGAQADERSPTGRPSTETQGHIDQLA